MSIKTTNNRDNRLTNCDIATNYEDQKFWFMRSDFLGAFAYWVVAQSPYDTPDITKALEGFCKHVSTKVKDGVPVEFSLRELRDFISEDVFASIPEIEILNHPKIDTGAQLVFVSRDTEPHPDHDFIDLGALARNIIFMLLRNAITQP